MPAEPVGEADREQPAERAELQRLALDPLEVDLVAGEEEEHPEAEVGEEVDEVVGVGEVEDFGADEDPEQQLDDDHRRREALRGTTATVIAAIAATTTMTKKESVSTSITVRRSYGRHR